MKIKDLINILNKVEDKEQLIKIDIKASMGLTLELIDLIEDFDRENK